MIKCSEIDCSGGTGTHLPFLLQIPVDCMLCHQVLIGCLPFCKARLTESLMVLRAQSAQPGKCASWSFPRCPEEISHLQWRGLCFFAFPRLGLTWNLLLWSHLYPGEPQLLLCLDTSVLGLGTPRKPLLGSVRIWCKHGYILFFLCTQVTFSAKGI